MPKVTNSRLRSRNVEQAKGSIAAQSLDTVQKVKGAPPRRPVEICRHTLDVSLIELESELAKLGPLFEQLSFAASPVLDHNRFHSGAEEQDFSPTSVANSPMANRIGDMIMVVKRHIHNLEHMTDSLDLPVDHGEKAS